MKLNKTLIVAALLLGVFVLASCKSKEQRVIDKIEELTERMEEEGDTYTIDDWNAVIAEHAKIVSDAEDCDFDFDERRELSKAEREFRTMLITKGAKSIVGDYLNMGNQLMQGVMEGFGLEDIFNKKEE